MQKPRLTPFDRFMVAVGIVLFFIALSLALAACVAQKHTPRHPVGPTKGYYKSQPKFQ